MKMWPLDLNGTKHVGGTSSCMPADDGGTSFFPHQFASVSGSILFARINHLDENRDASVEDEEAILLPLHDRDRVRRIDLMMPSTKLLMPIIAMDGQFTVLERLFICPLSHDNMSLMLPIMFYHVVLPVRSPSLTTTVGLVELGLWDMLLLASFRPSDLVARLSIMPQLENLSIAFKPLFPPVMWRDDRCIPA